MSHWRIIFASTSQKSLMRQACAFVGAGTPLMPCAALVLANMGPGFEQTTEILGRPAFQIRSSWAQFSAFLEFCASGRINNLRVFNAQNIPTPPPPPISHSVDNVFARVREGYLLGLLARFLRPSCVKVFTRR